jgi:hypothetical protein
LQRLKLPPSPYECLATTDVTESPQTGVARRTPNVTQWRDREMVERWVASAWLLKEKKLPKNRWPSRSVGVGHDLRPSTSSSANRRRSQRKISWLLLPAFSYGWDTSGWTRDPNFRR